ncbi:GerMN domain-containing protein [Dehalobacterium formicoaceticum]|uniref:GerMN domain-containing protein n=1 Tax=Dehalobacterium formicoaceticum TaxID=51515 RepID=A0ABT1Y433_9FIRM|nr:GerMN domain-containing protein [Dehalobacterium formicoaceticum]MCR6545632.1 GerMN domain-containing protein [Dehalobacterium formicoaceticum]
MVKDQELVVVYFASMDKKNLIPVTLGIKPTPEAARVAMEKLLAGPENEFSAPTIPEGTKLKDMYLVGTTAYVDLTEELLTAPRQTADQTVKSIVFTMTEFPGVEDVQIMVNGQIEENLAGVDISQPFKRPDAINYYGAQPMGQNLVKAYFSDDNAIYLVPVTLQADTQDRPLAALRKLLEGPPKNSGLGATLWPGTKIHSFHMADGLATIDFNNQAFGYGGGSTAELMFVNSVLYTLSQFSEIKQVKFLFEGKEIEYLPEGTDMTSPIQIPNKINFMP